MNKKEIGDIYAEEVKKHIASQKEFVNTCLDTLFKPFTSEEVNLLVDCGVSFGEALWNVREQLEDEE